MKNIKEISTKIDRRWNRVYKKFRYRVKGYNGYKYKRFLVDGKSKEELQTEVDSFFDSIWDTIQDIRKPTGAGFIDEDKWDLSWVCEDHRLKIIEQLDNRVAPNGNAYCRYLCKCLCGKIIESDGVCLLKTEGGVKSCGCLRNERVSASVRKHGKRNHKLHSVWSDMKHRCNNPNNKRYDIYGGKGVKVCNEWSDSFEVFYAWAIANGYEQGLSLDRIDGDLGYTPNNCRWIAIADQSRNVKSSKSNTGYNGLNFKVKGVTVYICVRWSLPKEIKTQTFTIKVKITSGFEEFSWREAVAFRLGGLITFNGQGYLYDSQIKWLKESTFPFDKYEKFLAQTKNRLPLV